MKITISIGILSGILFFASCHAPLSTDKMTDVMFDITLAMNYTQQEIITNKITDTLKIKNIRQNTLDTICAIHNITPEELKYSFNYYAHNPLKMQVILDSVDKRCKQLLEQKITPDSIKK